MDRPRRAALPLIILALAALFLVAGHGIRADM